MITEFRRHLDHIRHSNSIKVLVLRSSLPNVFCAGADLKERASMNEQQVGEFVHNLRQSFTEFAEMPMPTIACIDGFALGYYVY
jgi:methylglutaconyl-CoA hydratase